MAGTLDKTFNTPDGYITAQIIPGLDNRGYSVVTDSIGRSIVIGVILISGLSSQIYFERR